VAEADSNNIRDRMLNLEKQFHKIPANQLQQPSHLQQQQDTQEDDKNADVIVTNRY
jgi:hypothetical protein